MLNLLFQTNRESGFEDIELSYYHCLMKLNKVIMKNKGLKILNIQPDKGGAYEHQLFNCLIKLQKRIWGLNLSIDQVLKVSIFFHPGDSEEYLMQRRKIEESFKNFFGSQYPNFSVISIFPNNGYDISLEAFVYTNKNDYSQERKMFKGHRYSVLENEFFKELYVAGINIDKCDGKNTCISEHAEYIFSISSQILKLEGLEFSNIVRSWNYIEDITGIFQKDSGIYQNYQVFNEVRASYYNQCTFENGYSAATAIGMAKGGIVGEFIAVSTSNELNIIPVRNCMQTDAYSYSKSVLIGCTSNGSCQMSTPKFERAKQVIDDSGQTMFISGTASIMDENTVDRESISDQTKTTLKLIHSLLLFQTDEFSEMLRENELYFRVYVKQKEHLPIVKAICENILDDENGQYLIADVCRRELLVEIECISIYSDAESYISKLLLKDQKTLIEAGN